VKSALKGGVFGAAIGGVAGAAVGWAIHHTVWLEFDTESLGASNATTYRLGLRVSVP
jgi:hypothetical protein